MQLDPITEKITVNAIAGRQSCQEASANLTLDVLRHALLGNRCP